MHSQTLREVCDSPCQSLYKAMQRLDTSILICLRRRWHPEDSQSALHHQSINTSQDFQTYRFNVPDFFVDTALFWEYGGLPRSGETHFTSGLLLDHYTIFQRNHAYHDTYLRKGDRMRLWQGKVENSGPLGVNFVHVKLYLPIFAVDESKVSTRHFRVGMRRRLSMS